MTGWKLKAVMITVVAGVLVLLVAINQRLMKCNMSSVLNQLCLAYKAGNVSGSLCPDLCEQNNVRLGQCLSTVPEKQIYDAEWGGRQVILKINVTWFNKFRKLQNMTDNDAVASYENEVLSRVKTLFGDCPRCSELTSILLSLGDGNGDGSVRSAEARTFISLLQHLEPMMLMALNKSKHTVDIYGYCGGLYAVEKVPFIASELFGDYWELLDLFFDALEPFQIAFNRYAGNLLNAAALYVHYADTILNDALALTNYPIFSTLFQVYVPSKREQFKLAYSLLDAILALTDNPYGLVQQCDGHFGNFGITRNGIVKVIDLDLLFPYAFIKTRLQLTKCVSDEVCWVGNNRCCLSTCNTSTGFCSSVMQFQDLHIICEVVFPQIFNGPSIHEPQQYNTTFLKKAIRKLGLFCGKLPAVYSVEEMRHNVLDVKKKLRYIEIKSAEK